MAVKALLVDDEKNNLENLKFLLENDCTGIDVVGMVDTGAAARTWLQQNKADVVFLDISMPGETGFEMLERIPNQDFRVIFVTAHNEFAMQAIKASAVDYLLKPVNITELQHAVEKLKSSINKQEFLKQNQQLIQQLVQNFKPGQTPVKIALPQLGSISFLDVNEIVSLQADSNYTIIHKQDMQKNVITKTLKDFEDILDGNQFVRVHKSHIVNLKYVKEYSTADGGIVKMNDGNVWSISRRQLDLFLQKMKTYNVLFFK
ncbi:MAG TPA: LytTR family DNA-binding domain-containing protein [Ferruginibacter sp.]|nr:LytTR family DNA-binding domain-containing protein [Ferruginibacter sp.]